MDLSLESKTLIKLVKDDTGESFCDFGVSRDFFFFFKILKAQSLKEKMDFILHQKFKNSVLPKMLSRQ